MKIIKKVARVISDLLLYFLLAIIVLLIAYVITIKVYQKQNKLGEIPINIYTILTQSMYPKIKAGDIVVTYKNKDNIYKVGDVITFVSEANTSNGITITHRVVNTFDENGKMYYYTKGDANNTKDSAPVSSGNVIGKVLFKIPKAGYIQQFMVTKFGWLVVVVLPCAAIIIYDMVKIIEKAFKKKKHDEMLSLEETGEERDDLNKIINSQCVSTSLKNKINDVYEDIGVENIEVLEDIPEEKSKDKGDDNVEVL